MNTLGMVQEAQNKALRIINFKEERHLSEAQFIEAKILNLTNIITLNNCIFFFYHLSKSIQAIFDDPFNPFKDKSSHNTREAGRYFLSMPKMETSFYDLNLV